MANKPWISNLWSSLQAPRRANTHTTGHSKHERLKAGPRLRTLEVRGGEGRMGDLPVERLPPGALARRLRRAEPLGTTSVTSRRRTCKRMKWQTAKRVRQERELAQWRLRSADAATVAAESPVVMRVRVLAPLPHRSDAKRTPRKRGRRRWMLVILCGGIWRCFWVAAEARRRRWLELEGTHEEGKVIVRMTVWLCERSQRWAHSWKVVWWWPTGWLGWHLSSFFLDLIFFPVFYSLTICFIFFVSIIHEILVLEYRGFTQI